MRQSLGTLESWQTGASEPPPSQVLLGACVSLSGWCLREGGLLPKLRRCGRRWGGCVPPSQAPNKKKKEREP